MGQTSQQLYAYINSFCETGIKSPLDAAILQHTISSTGWAEPGHSPLPVGIRSPSQLLERAIEEGLQADGTFVAINNRVSQSVPHLHIHLVPRRRKDGLKGFFWPRQRYKDEADLLRIQEALRSAIARIQSP